MPESVRDRCTKAHEYIFLLTKSPKYFYDADAIKEPLCLSSIDRAKRKQKLIDRQKIGTLGKQSQNHNPSHGYSGLAIARNGKTGYDIERGTRNKRSVWEISTKHCKEAHFATFPIEIPLTCIKAGSPVGGVILDPFMGAGTTAIAAQQLSRHYIGIELNPEYRAIALNRIEATNNGQLGLFDADP